MRRLIFTFLALSLLAAFFSCSSDVEYAIKEIPATTGTNKYYATSQLATKVYFYLQNKDGDPELSTYERDTAADMESANIPKGTPLSQLESLKSYAGFTLYTASQSQDALNLYYSRNNVKYEFYTAKEKGTLVFRTTGLYESKLTPPTYTPQENCLVVAWLDFDGNAIEATYGAEDKKFYPRLLPKETALGTKSVADTRGDILLDDGSAISYREFCALDASAKSKIVLHAFGVLVCANYKDSQNASSAPEDGNDEFYKNNVKGNSSLFSGGKKLIAAVYKKDDYLYNGVPWISNNETLQKCSMSLEDYFDGEKNTALLKSLSMADGDYTQGLNAFSSCDSYGDSYCPDTKFADGWHLPSIGELGLLYDTFFSGAGWTELLGSFYDFSGAVSVVWTSNVSSPPYNPNSRPVRKSWSVEFSATNMNTVKTSRDQNGLVIPFLICN